MNVGSMFDKGYISPVFGGYVFSKRKDDQLMTVLRMNRPNRENFYFFALTLQKFNMPLELVIEVVEKNHAWENYDPDLFRKEIGKVYNVSVTNSSSAGASSCKHTQVPAFQTGADLVSFFKTFPSIPLIDISYTHSIMRDVATYSLWGISVVPRNGDYNQCGNPKCIENKFCKHPHISLKWSMYQDRQPTFEELESWKELFNVGLCLIANNYFVYLDGDPAGMRYIDQSLFVNRHWEKTRRGYHFFARGTPGLKPVAKDGIELKAKGSLIVAAPTTGYISAGDWMR